MRIKERKIDIAFETSRRNHLLRTGNLWKRLVELGATEQTPLNFDFNFSTKNKDSAEALKLSLLNYRLEISTISPNSLNRPSSTNFLQRHTTIKSSRNCNVLQNFGGAGFRAEEN
jgi:hypothetical protein